MMTMTTPAVLDGVLALLSRPETWTKNAAARDMAGKSVPATSPEAVAWSLDGAIERIVGYWEDETITNDEADRRRALEAATFDALGCDPAVMNDVAGHRHVVALLRAARARG